MSLKVCFIRYGLLLWDREIFPCVHLLVCDGALNHLLLWFGRLLIRPSCSWITTKTMLLLSINHCWDLLTALSLRACSPSLLMMALSPHINSLLIGTRFKVSKGNLSGWLEFSFPMSWQMLKVWDTGTMMYASDICIFFIKFLAWSWCLEWYIPVEISVCAH